MRRPVELITWLKERLAEDSVPGLHWTDESLMQFRLPAKHLSRRDVRDSDIAVHKVQKQSFF